MLSGIPERIEKAIADGLLHVRRRVQIELELRRLEKMDRFYRQMPQRRAQAAIAIDFAALLKHVSEDKLVLWGWDPGNGRLPVPHDQFVAAFKLWADAGGRCPGL